MISGFLRCIIKCKAIMFLICDYNQDKQFIRQGYEKRPFLIKESKPNEE